jgi:hypothetical protein
MAIARKFGGQEGFDARPRQIAADQARTERNDIGIIMLAR